MYHVLRFQEHFIAVCARHEQSIALFQCLCEGCEQMCQPQRKFRTNTFVFNYFEWLLICQCFVSVFLCVINIEKTFLPYLVRDGWTGVRDAGMGSSWQEETWKRKRQERRYTGQTGGQTLILDFANFATNILTMKLTKNGVIICVCSALGQFCYKCASASQSFILHALSLTAMCFHLYQYSTKNEHSTAQFEHRDSHTEPCNSCVKMKLWQRFKNNY